MIGLEKQSGIKTGIFIPSTVPYFKIPGKATAQNTGAFAPDLKSMILT
jgi:hypothetical protein